MSEGRDLYPVAEGALHRDVADSLRRLREAGVLCHDADPPSDLGEPTRFERMPDGSVVASHWPEYLLISDELLLNPDGGYMRVESDGAVRMVCFDVSNGNAVYAHDRWYPAHGVSMWYRMHHCVYAAEGVGGAEV